MPSDRFWAVAAKKAHLAVLVRVRVLVLWCGLRVAGCGLRVAGCGVGKAVLGRVFVRPGPDELMDGAFCVWRAAPAPCL